MYWQWLHMYVECFFSLHYICWSIFMLIMCLQCTLSRAFEQAGIAPGHAFSLKGDIDVEKIKQSKYFRTNLQRYNERATSELVGNTNTFSLSLIWPSNYLKQWTENPNLILTFYFFLSLWSWNWFCHELFVGPFFNLGLICLALTSTRTLCVKQMIR